MLYTYSHPIFWLEFPLLSDGLETTAVQSLPLTTWHRENNQSFHRFSALPTELRLKVWEYLIAPRIVGIACRKSFPLYLEDGTCSVEEQRDELWGSRSVVRPPIPVLLHINRETRALALKHYELSFEWKVPMVLDGTDMRPPAPAPPSPFSPPLSSPVNQAGAPLSIPLEAMNALTGTTSAHMSSYHDLLDPSPETNSSISGGGSSSRSTTTTTGRTESTTTAKTLTKPERRTSSPPRTWFNFDLDVVYLLGELEPCDSFGFNSPMSYFIPPQTARRVRKTAVSFGALRYGETGGQQIFGALFHVVDRFGAATPAAQVQGDNAANANAGAEVLICVTERDEWTHAMMGNETALVGDTSTTATTASTSNTSSTSRTSATPPPPNNVIEKIWRDWYRGAIVTSPLANLRFRLIREKDLEKHVYDAMVTTSPSRQGKKLKER
ncbi:hypothetical protein F5Y08DRAFT_209088 [Xylaria arbuscula]|nr:hypothetical protein F5Y08DRAFT_209088 [Xylaria arbuscula]